MQAWLIGGILILLCSTVGHADNPAKTGLKRDCLKISFEANPNPAQQRFLQKVQRLYDLAGLCIDWASMPPRRAEHLLLNGELDGNASRTQVFQEHSDKFFFISVPLDSSRPSLIALPKEQYDCTATGLAGKRLGYPAGIVWAEKTLEPYHPILVSLNKSSEAPELLMRGRIDIYIDDITVIHPLHEALRDKGTEIQLCVWEPVTVYHILHARHIGLKEKLETLLQSINAQEATPQVPE